MALLGVRDAPAARPCRAGRLAFLLGADPPRAGRGAAGPLAQGAGRPGRTPPCQGAAPVSRASDRAPTAAALRQRRRRARLAVGREIEFVRADWALFLHPDRLPQKAGSPRDRMRAMILKELVDNALDAGATATLAQVDRDTWIVTDDGPGLDRERVLRFFAVNRPMISTKLLRRPTRGALGNGLRVVTGGTAASGGTLTVESRGTRYVLGVDRTTGDTVAIEEGAS